MFHKNFTSCHLLSTVTKEEDEQEWLKTRTNGIGGSDIGAICGINHYSSPRDVYLRKTGQFKDTSEVPNASVERMHFGTILEPIVADEYAARTGKKLKHFEATLQSNEYPFAIANVDRFIVDDEDKPIGILECKTASDYLAKEWLEGEVPQSYIYQLQWYMFVTGVHSGAIAALVGGNKFYYYDIEYSQELIDNVLLPKAKEFWECVTNLQEPELTFLDNNRMDEELVDADLTKEVTFSDGEFDNIVDSLHNVKSQIKALEEIRDTLEAKIKDKMQDAVYAYSNNYVVTWKPRTSTRVNQKMLKELHPVAYSDCLTTSHYRVLTIKKGK